jgi:RNA polymerase sigma factor (sigma-70 family)
MANPTDHELLAVFVKNGSESAFSALVARYVNLVYSTALRHINNPHHAEEVTQAVFITLARKAGSISSKVVLSGWLYQTARLTAANHRRDNQRRQQREQQAIMESALNVPADESWKLIAPILDEAMNALGVTDRDAVLLRYFESKPLAEVGAALGVTEAAAEKRVSRALERLRGLLARHGVALGATAIAGAVSANAVQAAPAALTASSTAAALTATSLTSTAVALTTLQKVAVAVALAATIGGGIYAARQVTNAHKEVRELQAKQAPMAEEIRQLQSSLADTTNQRTGLMAENSELKSGKEEVLRLRGQIAAMRTQLASLENGRMEATNALAEGLHVRIFRIGQPRAFLEKADSALGHPVSSTPTQITADYFASKGINLEPPKSVYLNTSNGDLIARATDPELNAIESLLAEFGQSTPAQLNIKARFIEIPRQGFVMPSAIAGMKGNGTAAATGILSPAQLGVVCKALDQKGGVELLTESSVTTVSGRQCQIRTGDDAAPGQPAAFGAIVDLTPNVSADNYTIKLKAAVSAPETVNGEVNMYDGQTFLLSTTEKTKPDSQLIVLLTATLVDEVGNPVHADDELPFAQTGAPPQN